MTQANITIEDIPVSTEGVAAKLVKFQGQLDESNVDEKAKIIYDLVEQNPQNLYLLFDFEELEYMNSKSIGYLTDWYGKVTEGGGKIVVAKTRSNILDILQVVGLTQLINCYATLDEAKLALLQQPAGEGTAPSSAPAEPAAAPQPTSGEEAPTAPVAEQPTQQTPATPDAAPQPTEQTPPAAPAEEQEQPKPEENQQQGS